jgi:ATP-binding protein involved in chromosome partitioning
VRLEGQFLKDTLWGSQDFLIVDLPPGTGDAQPHARAAGLPRRLSDRDDAARRCAAGRDPRGQDVSPGALSDSRPVENMSYFVCPDCGERDELFGYGGGERMAAKEGTQLLARIPIYPDVPQAGDDGTPIVVANPAHPASIAFLELARRIAPPMRTLRKKAAAINAEDDADTD